jgi:hypothetical protein
MARQYREKVETELREICNDVLALLDKENDFMRLFMVSSVGLTPLPEVVYGY